MLFAGDSKGRGTSPLHQPAAPPVDFTGREAERRELRLAAAQRGSASLAIIGPGGVGKTALALQLAKDLATQYPDSQLFIEPRLMGRPLPASAIMQQVIRAYDPAVRLADDPAGLQAAYTSLLRGQRALLVVDNAAGSEQLAPLAPPAGCLLLATTGERIALAGLHALILDRLPQEVAEELLLKIAPRIGKLAAELAELCGGLPLALRLAGSALAARLDLDPAEYADRLQDKQWNQTGPDEARASLNLSCDLLTAEQQQLWRQLAVFPADFSRLAAAAVWEQDDAPADASLDEFARNSLVTLDGMSKRFRLHELAQAAAGERLQPSEREEAQRRHAAHYLKVLEAADTLFLNGGDSRARGLKLFDLEHKNILAAQAWAAAHAAEDQAAAKLAADYPFVGADVLSERQAAQDRTAWLEAAGRAAEHLGDRGVQGVVLSKLGSVYRRRTEPRWAIDYYERHLRIAREIGDRLSEGAALGNLGLAYAELGNTRRAVAYYEQHVQLAREIGDRQGEARSSWNLGMAYEELGDLPGAVAAMKVCVDFEREVGHPDAAPDAAALEKLSARLSGGAAA